MKKSTANAYDRPCASMFLEYNWTACCYQIRLGKDGWTSVNGKRSFLCLEDVKENFEKVGLKIGKKTDSRTWAIERA